MPPDFGYKYPGSIDLHPRSEDHKRLLAAIMERVQSSHEVMSARYDVWNQLDKTLTSFIPLDEEEKREQEKDNRKPFSIVVPTSYAALETLLTYLVQTFFEAPIFRYDGVGGEDVSRSDASGTGSSQAGNARPDGSCLAHYAEEFASLRIRPSDPDLDRD